MKKTYFILFMGLVFTLTISSSYSIYSATQNQNAAKLTKAVEKGNYRQVIRLVKSGANVNQTDVHGWTPLMYAVSYGNGRKLASISRYIQIAQYLMSKGANIHHIGSRVNAFTLAAKFANSTMLRLLARKGANVNINAPKVNYSAVTWAAYKGHVYTLQTLISLGARVRGKGVDGNNALHLAVQYHQKLKILYYLLRVRNGININEKNSKGDTALILAAKVGNYKNVQYLLRYGANVNIQNKKGETALMHASYSTKRDYWKKILVVKSLLRKYPKINLKDNNGRTALFWASNLNIVKLLVHRDNGADLSAKDNKGKTPLIHATEFGLIAVVKFLIKSRVNLNTRDKNGYTAMDHAVTMPANLRNKQMIALLKRAGAKRGYELGP